MAKSSVHNHLATLKEHGYVIKEEDTYYLSLRFIDHGTYARDRLSMREVIIPPIRRLADDTEEVVWFAVEEHANQSIWIALLASARST